MPWESGELSWAWMLSHAAVCGLVLFRVLGLCLTAPGLAIPELDWRFRIGLAAALCVVIYPVALAVDRRPCGLAEAGVCAGPRAADRRGPRLSGGDGRGGGPNGG